MLADPSMICMYGGQRGSRAFDIEEAPVSIELLAVGCARQQQKD